MDARKIYLLFVSVLFLFQSYQTQPTVSRLKLSQYFTQIVKCINEMGHNILLKNIQARNGHVYYKKNYEKKHSCGLVTFSKLWIIFFLNIRNVT